MAERVSLYDRAKWCIKRKVGVKWPELARALNFDQTDIDAIKVESRDDLHSQIFKMIHMWEQRQEQGKGTVIGLLQGLRTAVNNSGNETFRSICDRIFSDILEEYILKSPNVCGMWQTIAKYLKFPGSDIVNCSLKDTKNNRTQARAFLKLWVARDGWKVVEDLPVTLEKAGFEKNAAKVQDEVFGQSSADKPTEQDLHDTACITPVKEMTFSANKDVLHTEADSRMDDSNISASWSDVEVKDAVPPGPTAPRTGMDEQIGSALDIVGVPEYRMGLIGEMRLLGAVLGIGNEAKVILNRYGSVDDQLLEILDLYIAEKSPTWRDFCNALKRYYDFSNVRVKIEADRSSADRPTEQDLHVTARHSITPVEEMKFSANKDDLPTEDSGMDDSIISKSSSVVEDIRSQVRAALKNGSVKVEVVKSVFLGPPGVGKTQLKCALLGDFREVKESTNVSTPAAPAVEVILADTTQKKWELLSISHLNELSMDKNSWSDKQWSSSADTYGQRPVTRRSTSVDSQVTSSSQPPMRSTKPSGAVEKDTFESRSKRFEKIDRDILTFITEAKAKRGSKEKLEFKLVYIIDNGGQPSFLDFHSVTATFAASYVHLFDASKGLSDFPEMTFRKTKFSIRHMPPSIYSNVDLLRRSLLTVHQFKHRFDQRHEKLQALLGKTAFQPADSPHVLIVGTHKDSSKISVQEATKDLDSICESIPSLKDQYNIVFVDSLNRKCEGLRSICDTLSHEDNLSQFDLPLSWFQVCLLSLSVANGSDKNLHAQKYDDLYEMCRHQNHVESPEEFRAMITVMHCLGVFCIPELEQLDAEDDVSNVLIFFNPNLLFEYLTQIFAIPFLDLQSSESRISSHLLRKLQVRGVLTPECLSKLDIPDTLGTLPGFRNKLLGWLVDWCLAAKMDGEDQWFIPSVLPPRPEKTPPFVPCGYFENVFPLYLTFFQPEETTSNNCFHYLPAGFFPHLVVHLMQTGRFCLPENSKNNKSGYPYRCRDSIVLSERGSMKCTLNICLVDESDRLAVYMWPAYQLLSYDPSALCHAGAVLSDLKSCMTQTYEGLFCTSIGKITLCSACRCKPSSPQSSSQAVQPAPIHLAEVCLGHSGGEAWLQCLSHSGFGAPPILDIDDSLAKVLRGFSGLAQDLKSTGSVESETVDTLPDIPIVNLETTPIAGCETIQQLLDKHKDNLTSDLNSHSIRLHLSIDKIIPSSVGFEVEKVCYEKGNLILFQHLREQGDLEALKKFCKVVIQVGKEGYPKMHKMGQNLQKDLEQFC